MVRVIKAGNSFSHEAEGQLMGSQARRRKAESATLIMNVHEFDWSKVNHVVYDRNGVVIRSIPAIHLEGSVSFILEWNGLKLAFSGDTLANKVQHLANRGTELGDRDTYGCLAQIF